MSEVQAQEVSSTPAPVVGTPEIAKSDAFKAAAEAFTTRNGLTSSKSLPVDEDKVAFEARLASLAAEESENAPESEAQTADETSAQEKAPKTTKSKAPKVALKGQEEAPKTKDLRKQRLEAINAAKMQQKLTSERDELKSQLEKYKEFDALKAQAKNDPYGWVKLGGFSDLDEFTAAMLDKGAMTPAERKVFELEQNLKKRDEVENLKAQALEKAREEQLQAQAKLQLRQRLETDKEKYELSLHGQGPDLVYAVMNELANQKPNITEADLDEIYHTAASYIEKFMEDDLDKIMAYDKVKKKLSPATKLTSSSAPRPSSPRTISSKMSAQTTQSVPPKAPKGASSEDRIRLVGDEIVRRFQRL